MKIKISKLGMMLDQIVFEALETDGGGVVEAALALNPGLAERLAANGHELSLNSDITLPEKSSQTPVRASIKLWD